METKQIILSIIILLVLVYNVSLLLQELSGGDSFSGGIDAQKGIANNLLLLSESVFHMAKIFGVFTILIGIGIVWLILKNK